jgi:sec-independent protein translocase protein TatC
VQQGPAVPAPQAGGEADGADKPFLEHLEELRWHLIRSVSAIFVFAAIGFMSSSIVFGVILLGPSRPDFLTYRLFCELAELLQSPMLCIDKLPFVIQNRSMMGQFSVHLTSSMAIGFVCAFPYAFWEIWRFVQPGLYPKERAVSRGATAGVTVLFLLGVFFGYFIVSPLSINFLSNYQIDPSILNEIDLTSYINTVVMITLACGIMFQLPMVVYFLAKVGIVTPALMRTYRRHAIVVIMLIGAIITPPDVFSQILVGIPVTILYEVSIIIAARIEKRRQAEA